MILEQNPRIGGAVDLGQFEKLKDLKASGPGLRLVVARGPVVKQRYLMVK